MILSYVRTPCDCVLHRQHHLAHLLPPLREYACSSVPRVQWEQGPALSNGCLKIRDPVRQLNRQTVMESGQTVHVHSQNKKTGEPKEDGSQDDTFLLPKFGDNLPSACGATLKVSSSVLFCVTPRFLRPYLCHYQWYCASQGTWATRQAPYPFSCWAIYSIRKLLTFNHEPYQ